MKAPEADFTDSSNQGDLLADEHVPPLHDAAETASAVSRILDDLSGWSVPESPISCDGKRWMPHLIGEGRVLHVHLADALPRWVATRLKVSSVAWSICVALKVESLYDEELLLLLSEVNADVLVLDGSRSAFRVTHFLAALADESVPVSLEVRKQLALDGWRRRRAGSNYEKGHHFEGLMAFLLSQVNGFKIFERNFHADTDEIDIVVQLDGTASSRCWAESGVPFVIVEAKNWIKTVGSGAITLIIRKLETRRGRARIGILFATSGVSSEARDEELKESKGDYCVTMLGPSEIEAWIEANDPDQFLEDLIAKAMLR